MAYKGQIKYYLKERQRPYNVEWVDGHVEEGHGLPIDGVIIALHVAKVRHEREIRALRREIEALKAKLTP